MTFTITEFRALIHFLETQPEWRMELRRLLFPEALVDLPRALEALAEAQRRTEETLGQVTERMERGFAEAAADCKRIWEAMQQGFAEAAADRKRIWENIERLTERMERGFAEAAADRERIWEAMRQGFAEAAADREVMKRDIGVLKGSTKESFYRDRAAAIFGRLLTAGQDATEEVVQRLRAAQQANRVSAEEYQSVLNADLLWSGKLWDTGEEVILGLEAFWKVHEKDVERAVRRAEVLRRAGLKALPVTAGEEWPEQVETLAFRERVVITRDGRVDDASWQAALASL
jgi:rubrerythrin